MQPWTWTTFLSCGRLTSTKKLAALHTHPQQKQLRKFTAPPRSRTKSKARAGVPEFTHIPTYTYTQTHTWRLEENWSFASCHRAVYKRATEFFVRAVFTLFSLSAGEMRALEKQRSASLYCTRIISDRRAERGICEKDIGGRIGAGVKSAQLVSTMNFKWGSETGAESGFSEGGPSLRVASLFRSRGAFYRSP